MQNYTNRAYKRISRTNNFKKYVHRFHIRWFTKSSTLKFDYFKLSNGTLIIKNSKNNKFFKYLNIPILMKNSLIVMPFEHKNLFNINFS